MSCASIFAVDLNDEYDTLSSTNELTRSERHSEQRDSFWKERFSTIGSFIESIASDKPKKGITFNFAQNSDKNSSTVKAISSDPLHEIKTLLQSRITMNIQATKKGGDFELPGGARLKIPEDLFTKKEAITVALIPPNKRHEYYSSMKPYEKMASNIYLVHAKSNLKGKIELHLPSLLPKPANIVALHKPINGPWHEIENITKHDADFTVCTSDQGAFTLLEKPPEESFSVTPNGGLYQAKIDHAISVRIPKRCTTYHGSCALKIFSINESRIAYGRTFYPRQCASVERLSPFYDFSFPDPKGPAHFKRPITLKLPLPPWFAQMLADNVSSDLTVMEKRKENWEALDAPLKITKSTVSFDTTALTRFCLIQPRKDCRVRAYLSMPLLERCNQIISGEILVFASLDAKAWHVLAECVPQNRVVEKISERVKKGFTFLQKVPVTHEEEPKLRRLRTRTRTVDSEVSDEMEFQNNAVYLLSFEGDLQFKARPSEDDQGPDEEAADNCVRLQFHELFQDNYRCVEIEPKSELKEKAEAIFLQTVAAERARKAKAKAAAEEEEKRAAAEKKAAAMARATHKGRSLLPSSEPIPMQNGLHVHEASSDPYAAPMPSPVAPAESPIEDQECETEEDAEREMAERIVNCCISCRLEPFPEDETNTPQNGGIKGEPGSVFARFPLVVDMQDVIEYYGFEPPPEVDPEAEAKAKAEAEAREKAAAATAAMAAEKAIKSEKDLSEMTDKKAKSKSMSESFQRLTATTKQPTKIIKESKVLSGRSLQILSRYVQNGLTLAVHLNLPDSVITGIGFDSLSNLHCLNDVTYKVLLHWKRTYNGNKKDNMVPDLLGALKAMGFIGIAAVIADRHRSNTELSPGCFDF